MYIRNQKKKSIIFVKTIFQLCICITKIITVVKQKAIIQEVVVEFQMCFSILQSRICSSENCINGLSISKYIQLFYFYF